VLYQQKPLEALEHHPNHVLISSLAELRNEVRTWRNIGLGVVIAFIALTLSLLSFGSNVYRQVVENLKELEQDRTKIELLQKRIDQLPSTSAKGESHETANEPNPDKSK
jgi:hypothetical protein